MVSNTGRHPSCTNTHTHTHEPMHNSKRAIHKILFIPHTHRTVRMYTLTTAHNGHTGDTQFSGTSLKVDENPATLISYMFCPYSTSAKSMRCYALLQTSNTTRARDSSSVGIQHKEAIRRGRERKRDPNEQQLL